MPHGPLSFLRDYFQKNSAFNLLLTGELLQVLAALEKEGIEAVPYKGPAIAARFYGHVALRQFCDIDILVRERDVWRAGQLIEARGFEPHFAIAPEWREAYLRQTYVQLFRRDGGRTLVELHWGIAPPFFAVRFDAAGMWERLRTMRLQSTRVRIPCAEDLLLMLCVHGSRHAWDKLESVASIVQLLRDEQDFDWQAAWERAGEMRCRRMLALALLLAHGLFELPIPQSAAGLVGSARLRAQAAAIAARYHAETVPPRTFGRSAAFHLRLKDSCADQARYCARVALTSTPDDWAAVRLHRRLSFAYPLVRAVRVARKRLGHPQAAGSFR